MEHAPHSPFVESSGDACDSWHRWPEDLDLVAGSGLNTYRFSLEWSRIEPAEREFSRAALDHYRRIVDGCRDRGLNPLVTLVHFTMPRWLMHDGGWTGTKTGDRISRYSCSTVSPLLTPWPPNICTAASITCCAPSVAAILAIAASLVTVRPWSRIQAAR